MRIYKRGKVWQFEVRRGGKHYQLSLKTQDEEVARLRAIDKLRQIELGDCGDDRERELWPLVERFMDSRKRRGLDESYMKHLRARLEHMLHGLKTLGDVTPAVLEKRAGQKVAPRTQNQHLESVSTFFRWLLRQRLNVVNPVAAVEPAKVPQEHYRRALTEAEVRRLVESVPLRRAVFYALAATSGLRRNELRTLRWKNVDSETGLLLLEARNTKARRSATLPIHAWAKGYLDRWREQEEPSSGECLVWGDGIPSTLTVRKDMDKAGIARETPEGRADLHALRVFLGTQLAENDVPLQVAQSLLRHSTPALTAKIYTRIRDTVQRAAIDKVLGG